MEYNVGDKVKIKDKSYFDSIRGPYTTKGLYIALEMHDYFGKEGVIVKVRNDTGDNHYYVEPFSDWVWDDTCFDKIIEDSDNSIRTIEDDEYGFLFS